MKRLISLAFVAVFAAFVACEKENTVSPVKEHKTISATIPAGGLTTRVALTQDETDKKLIKLSWEDTDVITVNGVDFVIVPTSISADGKTADFDSGSAPDPTPDGAGKYNITCSNLPGSFSSQTQAADGSTEHLKYGVIITGADSYADVTFSEAWASQHGATIALSSVLRLRALLPAAIASTVKKVIIKASEDDFAGGKTLEVTLTNPGTAGTDNILDVYATLPAAADITTSDDVDLVIQFQVSNNENDKYTAYRKIAAGTDFIKPGAAQYIGIDCSNITSYANASNTGIGSSSNPYLIGDKYQLDAIRSELVSGETKYFKLVDDIDMTDVSWTVLNNTGSYDKVINLDGNHKTISNLGGTMFYVFKGSANDLKLDNPTITAGNKKGAFAQFIQGVNNYITNVDVCNVSSFAGSNGPCGGLIGLINSGSDGETTATFENCDVTNVAVNSAGSSGMAGGLIGSVEAKVVLTNCTYSGNNVANTYDFVGGLIGMAKAEISLIDCSVSNATISGRDAVGGLVGHCEAGGSLTSGSVTADISGRNYIGGLVGRESTASGKSFSVSKCSFEKRSSGLSATNQYAGGILGNQYGAGTITIENCFVNSPISAANAWAGGISSNHYNGTLTIGKCYVMGSVSALYGAGGIVGQVRVTNLTINPCAVYVSSITATDTESTEHESSGTIVAYGYNVKVTIARDCWYDQTLTFAECAGNSGSPTSWCPSRQSGLSNAKISGGTPHSKIYPYWGRYTNPSDYPLNTMCKDILKFSSDDWNLDVNPPTLK